MKKNIFVSMMISTMLIAGMANAQSFKETSIAFRKFEAKITTGINYSRYIDSLSDIEYAVSEYEANADSLNKGNAEIFRSALSKYKKAGDAWGLYIELSKINMRYGDNKYEPMPEISNKYCNGKFVNMFSGIDICLDANWKEASDLLKNANEVLKPPTKAVVLKK